MANTVDELLEKLREQITTRRQESEERVGRIKAAADEYLKAIEADLVRDVAVRLGLEAQRTSIAVRAALTLRSLIEALPEARVRLAETATPEAVTAETDDEALDEAKSAAGPRRTETDPEVEALYREFQATDFEGLTDGLFKPWAEEFACRARGLQTRGLSDGNDLLTRMFRVLTAKAFQRNTRDIFGLARNHHGDWTARAERAKREREQVQAAPTQRAVATRIVIPEAIRAALAVPEEADEAETWPEMPTLLAECRERPLVLLGGVVKHEKLDRLKKHLGAEVEWIATDSGNSQGIASLERRVRAGRVGAVVILEELIGHRHFSPVVDAARQAMMPIAYGAKAGKASIVRALQDIEGMLCKETAATGT